MYRNTYDHNNLPGTFICRTDMGHEIKDYYPEDYVVIDLETTGLNPLVDEIIEICALRFSDNYLVDEYVTLVKPSKPVPLEITRITGINNEMLDEAESIEDALVKLQAFIGDTYVMGYCVNFDTGFIHNKMMNHLKTGFTNWYIDIHSMAKAMLPKLEHYRQIDVCKALNIPSHGAHRAKNDCLMCNEIYQILKEKHIEGYMRPTTVRAPLKITENGLRSAPFYNQNIYFLGTMEYSTKYDLSNILIGLGATDIDAEYREHTNVIIVGMAEANALESETLQEAVNRKKMIGSPIIIKERSFIEALKKKHYVE